MNIRSITLAMTLCATIATASDWEENFEQASTIAREEGKYMLLDFSGSDWCGWCIRLDREVFSQPEFKSYAKDNLVTVLIDFPQRKEQGSELKEQNKALMAKYKVRGFPTIIILSPTGELVGNTGYQEGGPAKYVEHLKGIIEPHKKNNPYTPPEPARKARKAMPGKDPQKQVSSAKYPANVPARNDRESRTWTYTKGTTVDAALVSRQGPKVVLKDADGKRIELLFSGLSEKDQDYITSLASSSAGR